MAEIKITLRQLKEEKETPIILRVYYHGFEIKCKTKKKCLPSLWENELGRPDKTAKGLKDLSKRLDYLKVCAQETDNYFENVLKKIATPKEFQEYFYILSGIEKVEVPEVDEKLTLLKFCDKIIKELPTRFNDKTGKYISKNTIKCYSQCIGLMEEFNKSHRKIDFEDIDLNFLHEFKELLIKKNYSQNTMAKHVKTLKAIMNEATEREYNSNLRYKVKKFSIPQVETTAIYLNNDELNELYNLNLRGELKLDRIRDLFLVGCYTGLRFSDFTKIRPENIEGDYITIVPEKTNDSVVIPIHKNLKAIMMKYKGQSFNSLPPSISNQRMNDYLKEIGQEIESLTERIFITETKGRFKTTQQVYKFQKLTTHTARRSFATNLYLGGFPTISIMKITGHKTEKAFLKYIRLSSKEHAKELKMFWEKDEIMKVV